MVSAGCVTLYVYDSVFQQSVILQPLRLDIKRKLTARSDRVKCVDLHPKEPWMLASLYNGNVHIWNHETATLIKSYEVSLHIVNYGIAC